MSIKKIDKLAKFKSGDLSNLFSFNIDSDFTFHLSTDSREIEPDQIFIPLVGEKFDGHNFIDEIFKKGIHYSFCQEDRLQKIKTPDLKKRLIIVKNTLDAYHKLANLYLKKIKPKVVAVTGSSGKTTMKELISSVLNIKYKVHKTDSNNNNEFGVPKTIIEMPPDTEILVLELAMRGEGQIRYLAKTSEPDIGIITNVGSAHIGILGNKESIIKAKSELLSELKKDGVAILFNDKELVNYAKTIWKGKLLTFGFEMLKDLSYSGGDTLFVYNGEKYVVKARGEVQAVNSLCTILVASELGLEVSQIKRGLLSFSVPEGRGNIICLKNNVYIVDDSYNANPDSVKASVSNVVNCWSNNYKKILVLGEVAELGTQKEKLLRDLNEWLKSKNLYRVITVGDCLSEITNAQNVKTIEECCDILEDLLEPNVIFVIKGSHIAGLDKVVNFLNGQTKNKDRSFKLF